ncbi:unnamed protein product, partial [Thlaspi arvense]
KKVGKRNYSNTITKNRCRETAYTIRLAPAKAREEEQMAFYRNGNTLSRLNLFAGYTYGNWTGGAGREKGCRLCVEDLTTRYETMKLQPERWGSWKLMLIK